MTEQLKAATIRAFYGALLTSGAATVAVLQSGADTETSLLAFLSTFFAYMLARGAAEGLIDSNRAPTSADVGQPAKPPPRLPADPSRGAR